MRVIVFVLLLLRVASADPINAIIGDRGVPLDATDEVARIRGHLSHVLRELRTSEPPVLSREQRARRAAALDELERYIARGEFPRRTQDAYGERRPRFIDDRGVHCAVGHLVAASGHEHLARSINATHEYDYVLDMREPLLDRWATANGFSLVELATIQPQYHEWPADYEAKMLLARVADELVLKCAVMHKPVNYVAFHVVGGGKTLAVSTTSDDRFTKCMAAEASKLTSPKGDYGDDKFKIDVELPLNSPQRILEGRLKSVDVDGCVPRPGDLPDSVTIAVETGTISVVTTPINVDVASCILERVSPKLLAATNVRGIRGQETKKLERYAPRMFPTAVYRAKERVAYDCQKATHDGVSMSFSATANVDGDVSVEVPGTTKFATCVRERLPGAIRDQMSVPVFGGEKYFRIDAEVRKQTQPIKCGNDTCY